MTKPWPRFSLIVLAIGCQLICGCGGGINSSNIKKYARKRDPDDQEAAPPPQNSKPLVTNPAKNSDSGAEESGAPRAQLSDAVRAATPSQSAEPNAMEPAAPSTSSETLTPEEQQKRTIQSLLRVAKALQAYTKKNKNQLPPAILANEKHQPLLSWRVLLLPYLGHAELYREFHLKEPWDSPHNRAMLAKIPTEYQSPLRMDEQTCLLAVTGSGFAFGGTRGIQISHFEDPAEETVALVEVEPDSAVPWTQPTDYTPGSATALGGVREDGFFAITAIGQPKFIEKVVTGRNQLALFTIAGLDGSPNMARLLANVEPPAEPTPSTREDNPSADKEEKAVAGDSMPANEAASRQNGAVSFPDLIRLLHLESPQSLADRQVVPDEDAQKRAKAELRTLYKQDMATIKSRGDWRLLARKLLDDSEKLREESTTYYVLLLIAREMAIKAGDLITGLEVAEKLATIFAVDGDQIRLATLEQTVAIIKSFDEPLQINWETVVQGAVERNDFSFALKAQAAMAEALKRKGDRAQIAKTNQYKTMIEVAQAEFEAVPAAMEKLKQDPNDPIANLTIGRYLCFIHERWTEGLPLMAKCHDVQMRGIAVVELEAQKSPRAMTELADQWWALSQKSRPPINRSQMLRAVYWYSRSVALKVGGMHGLRAEKRMTEASNLVGAEAVTKAKGVFANTVGSGGTQASDGSG